MPSSPDPNCGADSARPGTRVPISCSLDAGDARAQLAEWRSVLAAAAVSTALDGAGTARMQLAAGHDLALIAALAEREVACCPFFRFSIEIDTHGTALVVTVPPDAAPILDAFAALAQT